jgi:hypothetical protein
LLAGADVDAPAAAAAVVPLEATELLLLLEHAARANVAPAASTATDHLNDRPRPTDRALSSMIWTLPLF